MPKFIFYKQAENKDCGPTCLRMVAKHYGSDLSMDTLREVSETTRGGTSLYNLSACAEILGFETACMEMPVESIRQAFYPCILHWNQNHFVVLIKVYNPLFSKKFRYKVADPAHGIIDYGETEFKKFWCGSQATGIVLFLEPINNQPVSDVPPPTPTTGGLSFLWHYLRKYKSYVLQIILGLAIGSIFQLILPFLTQSVVDVGIAQQDIDYVYLILAAQLALFLGRTTVEVLRSWILLHLSTRINISLISDFFIKLMALPIAYFDVKMTGDLMQRINDHQRIERILTTSSLSIVFSMANLVVFSIVLAYYSWAILGVFALGSMAYLLWIVYFLKKRRELDYKRFSELGREQGKVIELINGMQEIKLHNAERHKRWGWERLQARLFRVSLEGLALEQYQSVGSNFINELKNILITFIAASLVISGDLTLGMMLATSYIVGQLNAPIMQLIGFMREWQDAKIAMERIAEIHQKEEEQTKAYLPISKLTTCDLRLENVRFRYPGSDLMVLDGLDVLFSAGKTTAIVGSSGSGKTTLLKLLLGYYKPVSGYYYLGENNFSEVSISQWRAQFGVVMQENFIFNDTIAGNIALGFENIDVARMMEVAQMACIDEFVNLLPHRYDTLIGQEGLGLSTGQKQRLMIARALYKNPSFIFFDEATSALDANNEMKIMQNLNLYFKNKTVIIVAHRLSTVKNADQIIVLEKGKIAEQGNHEQLTQLKGLYYTLVKNQLELGS